LERDTKRTVDAEEKAEKKTTKKSKK